MQLRGTQWLSIDLTHRCNLSCAFCGKRVPERRHTAFSMTIPQIQAVCKHFHQRVIRVSGGEPLVHPRFNEIAKMLLNHYEEVNVATNGLLLDRVDPDIFPRINFLVSIYPGVNDEAVQFAQGKDNVYAVRVKQLYDPLYNPYLSDDEAHAAYLSCPYIQIKVIRDQVYGCCHAETSERFYDTLTCHTYVGKNWLGGLSRLPIWKACKHCFMARPKPYVKK